MVMAVLIFQEASPSIFVHIFFCLTTLVLILKSIISLINCSFKFLFYPFNFSFLTTFVFCQQLEGGISHLPLIDPPMRATPLTPCQWKQRLEAANKSNESSTWKSSRNFILLDVRNGTCLCFLLLAFREVLCRRFFFFEEEVEDPFLLHHTENSEVGDIVRGAKWKIFTSNSKYSIMSLFARLTGTI